MRRFGLGFLILAAAAGAATAAAAEDRGSSGPPPSLEYRPQRVVIPEPNAPKPLPPKVVFTETLGSFGILTGSFDRPVDIARVEQKDDNHENGEFYVLDAGNNRIQRFSPDGRTVLGSCGSRGKLDGEFDNPTAIAISPFGDNPNSLFVVDTGNHRIQICGELADKLVDGKVFKTCPKCKSWGTLGSGQPTSRGPYFKYPRDIASIGNIVAILDSGNERIQFFKSFFPTSTPDPPLPELLNIWDRYAGVDGGTFSGLTSIAFSGERTGYIYTFGAGCVVQQFQPDRGENFQLDRAFNGKLITSWPAIPPESGMCVPARMEIDSRFNYVYVLDSGNSQLSCYNPVGLYRWTLGGARVPFSKPLGFAVNRDGEEVLVADTENDIVQKFTLR